MTPERTAVLVVTGVVAVLLALTIVRSERDFPAVGPGQEDSRPGPHHVRNGGGTHFIVIDDDVVDPPVRPVVDDTPPPQPRPRRKHVVRKGDTLDAIARRLVGGRGALQALMAANPGLDPRRLQLGLELVLPAREAAPRPQLARDAPRTHVVRKGETLEVIARRLLGKGAAWKRIFSANRDILSSPHRIRMGMCLRIPDSAPY